MSFENVPAELKDLDRWVVWKWKPDPDRPEKPKKPPFVATDLRRHASSTDASTWSTFEQAVAVVEAFKADGIGFALMPPYVGIDLDPELDDNAQWLIIYALDSYGEVSASGKGHHVIVKAKLDGKGRHPEGLGVFTKDRFFYFTGDHLPEMPTTIEKRQGELERVIAEFMPRQLEIGEDPEDLVNALKPPQPVDLDDRELLRKAFAAKNGKKFHALWLGHTAGYASPSEADQALMNMLAFWTGRDPVRMDQLFRQSGLVRPKWDREDYREATIGKAIEAALEVYVPERRRGSDAVDAGEKRQPIPTSESVPEWVGENASQTAGEGAREGTDSSDSPVRRIGREESVPVAAPVTPVELVFQSAKAFAAEDEKSAELILGRDADDAALVAGGLVMIVGKGGSGKTTLSSDIAMHLATGTDWQGLTVPKTFVVAVIENDGPRGRFRRKVRAKLAAWEGDGPGDKLTILASPWGELRLSFEDHRAALAAYLKKKKVDVLFAGPIVSLGMIGGGTPDEVSDFEDHLRALRGLLERPLLVVLLHHTNQRGQVSGAWDRVPDTLMFLVNTGKGTRLTWQKTRDSSTLHGTTWKLRWSDGMTFELDDTPDQTEEDIEDAILAGARQNPGKSWTIVAKDVKGNAETKIAVRDRLIAEGLLVNTGTPQAFKLWHADDVGEDLDEDVALEDEA